MQHITVVLLRGEAFCTAAVVVYKIIHQLHNDDHDDPADQEGHTNDSNDWDLFIVLKVISMEWEVYSSCTCYWQTDQRIVYICGGV